MALLVVQVLKLEVQRVNLLASLGSLCLCLTSAKLGGAMETTELREVGDQELLMLRSLHLDISRRCINGTDRGELIDEGKGLETRLARCSEDG